MEPTLIKRYPNRRLYDTGKSAYITLEDLAHDLSEGRRVRVQDNKTGQDITQKVMIQALLTDRHAHKLDCLPLEFLRTLIQLEDPSMRSLFGHYVRMTLSSFTVAQNAMQQNIDLFKKLAPGPSELLSGLTHLLKGRRGSDEDSDDES
jgi:polyhydroxyalkanoate synthesis repressor PhaR